jgi:ATP-dependent helicase HrpB
LGFDYSDIDLPVGEVVPEVREKLELSNTLILKAPPGAGKSTLIPLVLMDEEWLQGKKIIMLEPRRLAAKSIANRLADLLGEKVGQSVGYRIRFETKVSDLTKIEVVTEGILTRMLQSDNALEDVGLVIFDEFHERSIHADTAMALCRESQQVLRSDLRILVMSATLELSELSALLGADVIVSEGRQFPVEVEYVGDSEWRLLPELAARTIKMAVQKNEGDILVFLPGQGEIKKCESILRSTLKGIQIHPLYGRLPFNKQQAAIFPDKEGRRKVILATSIAETSLTIEGVKVVVDSGFGRESRFDPNSALSRLETVRISKDSADQRAGRAGRLCPGVCYRMWTKATHLKMDEHGSPEIENADLASLVLDLAQWGIADPNQLAWLTVPPRGHLAQASDLLEDLDAIEEGKISDHGKAMYRLPTHPRIAHMLIKAEELDQLALACDVAALLEERDPMPRDTGIDINLRIEALRRYRKEQKGLKAFSRIDKIAKQYRNLFSIEEDNNAFDDLETGLLLAYAYPERIAHSRPGNNAQFKMANGRIASAGHKDDLAFEPWLAVAHVNDREGVGKIFMASPIDPKDLAPMLKIQEVIAWDTRLGGLIASKDTRIGNIILQSTPLPDPDDSELIGAISRAVKKEGQSLLNWDKDVKLWQNRVLSLRKWNPQEKWPDVSTETLLSINQEWLTPYLTAVKTPEDLKKINLKEVLQYSLELGQQKKLEELAPVKIKVPSGNQIKLDYFENGAPPILAVRLQECFGMKETPKINDGKIDLLMHLLSPGFKVVQITSDMTSFWQNAYPEIRKELRIRYSKHQWPEEV